MSRAISPVIATIILIAFALIMALVVGAFAWGLFGSPPTETTITYTNYNPCPSFHPNILYCQDSTQYTTNTTITQTIFVFNATRTLTTNQTIYCPTLAPCTGSAQK